MNLTQNQDCSKRLWHRRRQKNHHTQFPSFHYERLPDVLGTTMYCRPTSLSAYTMFYSINKYVLRFSDKESTSKIIENRHNNEWFAVTEWNYWDADKRTDSDSIHLFWYSLVHLLHRDNEPHHHISDTCVCMNHSCTRTDCVYKLQQHQRLLTIQLLSFNHIFFTFQ